LGIVSQIPRFATKVSIQKVIGSRWVCICKLNGRSLNASKVRDKSNLDKILKSFLGYCDLEGLHTSSNYLENLRKKLFIIIRQIGLPTFFVTFRSIERLWDPLIKALYTLHVKKLNFPNTIEDL
jgi:hypothetical protein